MQRLNLVHDDAERDHLTSYVFDGVNGQLAADIMREHVETDGLSIVATERTPIGIVRSHARKIADLVRESALPMDTKAWWVGMWRAQFVHSSRIQTFFRHVKPAWLDDIPADILTGRYNVHEHHQRIADINANHRELYYSMDAMAQMHWWRTSGGILIPGSPPLSYRTDMRDGKSVGVVEHSLPLMGTPYVGARSA